MVDVLVVAAILLSVGIFSVAYYKLFDYCVKKRLEAIKIPDEELIQQRYELQKKRLNNQAESVELLAIERA